MKEPYYSVNQFFREKFGRQKVWKIPINAGFSCPNKDGTLSREGCVFCDSYGSGPIDTFDLPIGEQIEHFKKNYPGFKYIAYYQANTNTHANLEQAREKYEIILQFPEIVGLLIGTRPDSIPQPFYEYWEELNQKRYLSLDLGLQSIHENSLLWLNRHHTYDQFLFTFQQLKQRNLDAVVHLIIGIPGETPEMMLETIREMNRLKPRGIKFHLLHVLKGTKLYDWYLEKKFRLLERQEYIELITRLLEYLDPEIVIHRLTGERDRRLFHAPEWALNKTSILNDINVRMHHKKSYQGRLFIPHPQ